MPYDHLVGRQYQRKFENRSMHPYFTAIILNVYHKELEAFLSFSYKRAVQIVSPEMSNAAYFEEEEMNRATDHFARIWLNEVKDQKVRAEARRMFEESKALEKKAWGSNWKQMSEVELAKAVEKYGKGATLAMSRFIISQPWHVASLETRLNTMLADRPNSDQLLRAATYYPYDLPWAEEDRAIKQLHGNWQSLTSEEQEKVLQELVDRYGWLNDVEGDKPFDKSHFRRKIEGYKDEKQPDLSNIDIPPDIYELGQLIGELGNLRLWGRHHWMQLRYHVKSIFREALRRSERPELEYATVDELIQFLQDEDVDLERIGARKEGYVGYVDLDKDEPVLVTGDEANAIRKIVIPDLSDVEEIKGVVANKGKARGRVRIISFADTNYHDQVDAFQEGEILVTGMTRPQIVHLCRKSAAIITDEGGITSHAAVVSRELDVPCIIATHRATNILKTGDLVEVDANTGVVRLL